VTELLVAVVTFLCLTAGAFAALYASAREPFKRLRADTVETVSLVANIFVVMTSLVLGLMMYSAKNTLETANHNVHALATDLILLDRIVRALGPEADETHRHLLEYLQESLSGEGNVIEEDPRAEAILNAAGTSLQAIRVSGEQQVALWNDARQLYRQVVHQRWVVVGVAGGTIPMPMIAMVVCWLTLIFASFGYRSPRNAIAATLFVLAALLISSAIFLVLDMDTPASGLIQASNRPLQHALSELQH
jgi:hypothetical protein